MRRLLLVLTAVIPGTLALSSGAAWAQFGPGGGMRPMGGPGGGMGGMGPAGQPQPDKPEGPAEAAPETKGADVATEALPAWPGQKEKALQFFQLSGYLRGRGFYWYNLNLGHFNNFDSKLANPFNPPLSEQVPPNSSATMNNDPRCAARAGQPGCTISDIRTADMRFRLEPTLNLSDQVRVKAQVDIFDNLVMGSTPDGFYINGKGGTSGYPSILSRGQVTQESAVNALQSSIRAKRAWAEVKTPLFELKFGRMPMHWGTGMLYHDGNCPDCDFGVNVDRVMATGKLWDHYISLSWDWASTGPTSDIVYNQQQMGWNYTVDNLSNVNQWTLMLGRSDDEAHIKDRLRRGESVFNYGAFLMYRTQDWGLRYDPRPQATTDTSGRENTSWSSPSDVAASLIRRSAWTVTADLYARLDWRKLHLEAEGAGVFGNIGFLDNAQVSIQQFGGLLRGHYLLLSDKLKIAGEIGSASGPQNGDPTGQLNWRMAQEAQTGQAENGLLALRNTRFTFDPDYHVDMILFRRILGTVYNATYFKPTVTYWLIDNFGGQVDLIYSMANRPATFPGHSVNMGVELNARLMYKNEDEGFYAGLEYGVLFSLGALEQKAIENGFNAWNVGGVPVQIGSTTAQVFQAKVMVKF